MILDSGVTVEEELFYQNDETQRIYSRKPNIKNQQPEISMLRAFWGRAQLAHHSGNDSGESLRLQWAAWMRAVAREGAGERIAHLLSTSERLLEDGYSGASVVTAFTALEVCGSEIVVESLCGG